MLIIISVIIHTGIPTYNTYIYIKFDILSFKN